MRGIDAVMGVCVLVFGFFLSHLLMMMMMMMMYVFLQLAETARLPQLRRFAKGTGALVFLTALSGE